MRKLCEALVAVRTLCILVNGLSVDLLLIMTRDACLGLLGEDLVAGAK
jgi:hypothetical protein